jgi:valyl-tRNA synthetase
MPFITEEIWQTLPHRGTSIVIQPYPTPMTGWDSKEAEAAFAILEQFVTTARTGRALLNYPPGKPLVLYGAAKDRGVLTLLQSLQPHLAHLARGTVCLQPLETWPGRDVLRLVMDQVTVGVLVEGDVDLQKALERVVKQREEGHKEAARLDAKLGNREFTAKAPPEVVVEHEQRLRTLRHEQDILTSSEQQLRAMSQGRQS